MATAGVSQESLDLLQEYKIDVRDFTSASIRFVVVLEHELISPAGEQQTPEIMEATRETQEKLKKAWNEYILSAGQYFTSTVQALSDDIQALREERDDIEVGSSSSRQAVSASNTNTAGMGETITSATGSFNKKANPLGVSQSSFMSHDSYADSLLRRPVAVRAERLNELCNTCDKWLRKNERLFVLPQPEVLVEIVRQCVSSTSQLFRLLGLHLAAGCVGNKTFTQILLNDQLCVLWISLCADREVVAELGEFLDLAEALIDALDLTMHRYPYSWINRIASLLRTGDPTASVPAKRRSQGIRIALHLLKKVYPQATAARLHIFLLRACTAKNFVTVEEMYEILDCVLSLFNNPKTREYIQLSDINVLFAPLLATPNLNGANMADYLVLLNNAKDAIVYVLSTWVGNLWLASETTSLRALIDLIHLPGEMDRRMIILTLFNKLLSRLAPHRGIVVMDTWSGEEEARRRRELKEAEEVQQDNFSINYSMGGPTDQMLVETVDPIEATEDVIPTMKALGYHVMDPLLGYVLLNLLHQGLPLALVASVTSLKFSRIALEATGSLLQDVVVLMDSVLPRNTVRVIHEAVNMSVGKLTFTKDSVAGDLTSKLFHVFKETQVGLCRDYTNGIEGTLWGQGMQSTQLYSSVGGSLDMEERAFRNAVVETRVETSPMDWKSWNFDLLHVLMQGPFRNRNRMASCTKLFRILIGFYTPPNANRLVYFRQFATLAAADVTQTMCQLCLEMTDLLLSTREGATLLNVAELPRAMIAVLKEVRHGKPKVLSKERVNSIVGQTVLRQMMRLTAHANGLILMREHGFFEEIDGLFAKLSGSRVSSPGPEDTLHEVCNQLLQYMCISAVPNFGVCDDLRHTFRQALTNESNSIRLCAATQLRRALLRDLSSSLAWGIEALVLAIQDSFLSVVECAFKLLLSICMSSNDALECLIKTKPSVLMESPIILANASKLRLNDLLYCIVKIPAGFRFLLSYGWIDTEMKKWESQDAMTYVRTLMSLQSGKEIVDEDFLQNHSFKGFHAQSFSLSDSISRRSRRAAVAILTESAISGANFFPIHFAEVLCTSTEGCEDMKQRDLWKRSVALLQQQPLPPDIVVDDVVDDSSDMSQQEESDNEDLNKHSRQDFHHRKKANHNSNNGMSSVVVMNGNTMNTVTTDNYNNNSVGMGISSSMVPKNVVRGAENTYTTHDTARREDNTNTTAQTKGGEEIAVVEQEVNSHELQRLKKGQLTQTSIISAARGYNRSAAAAYTLDCAGDPLKLMEAIIVVGMALSTEPGFTQLAVTEEGHLVEILFAIARFASHLTLRTCTQIALCLIARNRAGRKYMRSRDCCTVKNPDAYVSAEGIPYAVSFSHMRFDRTITLSRRKAKKNTAPGNAYAGYGGVDLQGIPKSIVDHVCSLANPVSRENAKKALYKALKKNPTQFLEPNVMRLCLEVSNVYRLDRAERKFITELIQRAQARPQKVPAVTSDGAK